jgi:excisionase family DNA binding protein
MTAADYKPKNRGDALSYIAFCRATYDAGYGSDGPSLEDWPHLAPVAMPDDPDALLTARQAAQHLSVTVEQLLALVHDGTMRGINVSRGRKRGRWRFTRADLDAFKASRIRQEQPCPFIKSRTVHTSRLISGSKVIGFSALRNAQLAKKLNRPKP